MDLKIILQEQISKADYNTHLSIFKYIVKNKINYELNHGVKFDINSLNKNQIKKLIKLTNKFKTIDNEMELFND
jgi:hypothetical protein